MLLYTMLYFVVTNMGAMLPEVDHQYPNDLATCISASCHYAKCSPLHYPRPVGAVTYCMQTCPVYLRDSLVQMYIYRLKRLPN